MPLSISTCTHTDMYSHVYFPLFVMNGSTPYRPFGRVLFSSVGVYWFIALYYYQDIAKWFRYFFRLVPIIGYFKIVKSSLCYIVNPCCPSILYIMYLLIRYLWFIPIPFSFRFSSVTQSCPTLCDPMNCSTPGLPVHHLLPEFTQTPLVTINSFFMSGSVSVLYIGSFALRS